jgi:hypothetical protein
MSLRMDNRVSIPIAILVGATLIALAILFVFRWQIISTPNATLTLRLDRWSSTVSFCKRKVKSANSLEMFCSVDLTEQPAR